MANPKDKREAEEKMNGNSKIICNILQKTGEEI